MTGTRCTIDATGIHKPDFQDVLDFFLNGYRAIYGLDVYLGNDSQDGQLLGLFATAVDDSNAQTVDVYNSRGPATAQGVGLSSIVKINGISRLVPSYSTVDLRLIGQAGASILNGIAGDGVTKWILPPVVTIGIGGEVTVTATAEPLGAILAPAETITNIETPTQGWQEVTNLADATPGQPVETDAALRRRQAQSTMLPSRTVLDGLIGVVAAIPGVAEYAAYENMSNAVDINGQPGHSIALVVDGGDSTTIAQAIAAKKTPGVNTYGTTVVVVVDANGIPHNIAFSRPTNVDVRFLITLRAFPGFTIDIQNQIAQAVSDWVNARLMGADIIRTRAYVPANLNGTAASETYEILSLLVARDTVTPGATDVPIAFMERAFCDPSYIVFTVVT